MLDSKPLLFPTDFPAIKRLSFLTLQVNLGYLCNQSCVHCHVDADPRREEVMSSDTLEAVLVFLRRGGVSTLDLTGGAPALPDVAVDLFPFSAGQATFDALVEVAPVEVWGDFDQVIPA